MSPERSWQTPYGGVRRADPVTVVVHASIRHSLKCLLQYRYTPAPAPELLSSRSTSFSHPLMLEMLPVGLDEVLRMTDPKRDMAPVFIQKCAIVPLVHREAPWGLHSSLPLDSIHVVSRTGPLKVRRDPHTCAPRKVRQAPLSMLPALDRPSLPRERCPKITHLRHPVSTRVLVPSFSLLAILLLDTDSILHRFSELSELVDRDSHSSEAFHRPRTGY